MAKKGYHSVTIRDEVFALLESIMKAEGRSSMSATIGHLAKEYKKKKLEGGDNPGS